MRTGPPPVFVKKIRLGMTTDQWTAVPPLIFSAWPSVIALHLGQNCAGVLPDFHAAARLAASVLVE